MISAQLCVRCGKPAEQALLCNNCLITLGETRGASAPVFGRKKPMVFLGMPRAGALVHFEAAQAFFNASKRIGVVQYSPGSSIVTYAFNDFWAMMLNLRERFALTHVAMIHADVKPFAPSIDRDRERPLKLWLDVLMTEMESSGADLVSQVIPLKDKSGLTSTAIEDPEQHGFWNVRRLALHEVWAKPVTWTEPGLLVNSGLWLAKIGPWCEKVKFRQSDRIVQRAEDKTFVAQTISEDWDFTRQVRSEGVKVYATRAVPLEHEFNWCHTREPWGEWKTDEAFELYLKLKRESEAKRGAFETEIV